MERLLAAIFWLVVVCFVVDKAIDYASANRGEIAAHFARYQYLYLFLGYAGYVAAAIASTRGVFRDSTPTNEYKHKGLSRGARAVVRPLVFFGVAILVYWRGVMVTRMLRWDDDEYVPWLLAVCFGLAYSFWPTSSTIAVAYTAILCHLRFIYILIMVTAIIIVYFVVCFISALILAVPIGGYVGLGYLTIRLGHDWRGSTGASVVSLAFLAIFLMSIRSVYEMIRAAFSSTVVRIYDSFWGGFVEQWAAYCINIEKQLMKKVYWLGHVLGGDVER